MAAFAGFLVFLIGLILTAASDDSTDLASAGAHGCVGGVLSTAAGIAIATSALWWPWK